MHRFLFAAPLAALPLSTAAASLPPSTCTPVTAQESLAEDWSTLLGVFLASSPGTSWMSWDFRLNPAARQNYNEVLAFFKVSNLKGGGFQLCHERLEGDFCFPHSAGIFWLCRITPPVGS